MRTHLSICLTFLSVWKYFDIGCPDHSGVVTKMVKNDTSNHSSCTSKEYILSNGIPANISWQWFPCYKRQNCIHPTNRCDQHPHPDCIYRNEKGQFIAEDEENCIDEYKSKGLVDRTANLRCQSATHNSKSPPIRSAVLNEAKDCSAPGCHYEQDQVVINKGTIVYTKATKCNNVLECMDGQDENGCNNTILDTIFI